MNEEEDLILGEESEDTLIDIIVCQLDVLYYISDLEHDNLYEDWKLHKTAAISRAMKIITKAQNIRLKELK